VTRHVTRHFQSCRSCRTMGELPPDTTFATDIRQLAVFGRPDSLRSGIRHFSRAAEAACAFTRRLPCAPPLGVLLLLLHRLAPSEYNPPLLPFTLRTLLGRTSGAVGCPPTPQHCRTPLAATSDPPATLRHPTWTSFAWLDTAANRITTHRVCRTRRGVPCRPLRGRSNPGRPSYLPPADGSPLAGVTGLLWLDHRPLRTDVGWLWCATLLRPDDATPPCTAAPSVTAPKRFVTLCQISSSD
jgi:hypothetical protein